MPAWALYLIWCWHGQKASEALDDFFYVWPKDSIDWQKINGIQIIMISNCRKIYIWQQILKRINSMGIRMNSGSSNDLNLIKIDPRTGEKFSFKVDIVAATEWHGQEASRF